MAQTLRNRSENDIKNKWNSMMRKEKRSRESYKVNDQVKAPTSFKITFHKGDAEVKPIVKGAKNPSKVGAKGNKTDIVPGKDSFRGDSSGVDEMLGLGDASFLEEALGVVKGLDHESSTFDKGHCSFKPLPPLQEALPCVQEAAAGTIISNSVETGPCDGDTHFV